MMHTFSLDPRDVLFFRDARPMGGADAGLGARLPRPDQLHAALLAAFHAQWPELQPWEGVDVHTFRDKRLAEFAGRSKDKNRDSSLRFGSLRIVGPFVEQNGERFFPTPLDVGMRLVPLPRGTNLPRPLTMGFLPHTRGKQPLPPVLPGRLYADYLAGKVLDMGDVELPYAAERTVQTAIDLATGTAEEGKFFQAEYLRLAPGARFVFSASCVVHPKGGGPDVDVFERPDAPREFQLGGQGGVVRLDSASFDLPGSEAAPTTRFVRWTILSPALFTAGWKPGWLNPDGRVMLPRADATVARLPGESRDAWRKRRNGAAGFSARLVAACIGRPVAFSGWDAIQNVPKPTSLAVPAGSCYVFACETTDEAVALAAALAAPRPRSDLFGEKGFGIGVCSFIEAPEI